MDKFRATPGPSSAGYTPRPGGRPRRCPQSGVVGLATHCAAMTWVDGVVFGILLAV